MIEVAQIGNRWTWTLIGICGRRIVWSPDSWPTIDEAASAAKAYRAALWALGDEIDHRQARAI